MSHYEDLRLSNDDGFRLLQDTILEMLQNQIGDASSYDEPDRSFTLERLRTDYVAIAEAKTVTEIIMRYSEHVDDTQELHQALEILAYMFIDVLQQVRR